MFLDTREIRADTLGIGIYYHFDYVGDPRDYKWINTIQLQKTVEQVTITPTKPMQHSFVP